MSRENCITAKNIIKQALAQLPSCGSGKGVSMAITHLEDAFMRVDYHMRQMGWLEPVINAPTQTPVPARTVTQPMRQNTLKPVQGIPHLNTGLMNQTQAPVNGTEQPNAALDDISLLD